MIHLHDISVSLRGATGKAERILEGISLDVPKGEWLVVVGPNGSGKTTLLRTIAGVVEPAAGEIEFSSPGSGVARGPRIALVLQDPDDQLVAGSVRNELLLSLPPAAGESDRSGDASGEETSRDGDLHEAIERFSLAPLLDRDPHRLSGGEKQRLVMASAWLSRPDILLLDEPLSSLDPQAAGECMGFVREMSRTGTTVVWASPGGDEILQAKRAVFMLAGRIEFDGDLDGLLSFIVRNRHGIGLPRIIEVGDGLVEELADERERRGGEEARGDDEPARASTHRRAAVTFEKVSFAYEKRFPVIESLDLAVETGTCTGVAGGTGSGKTTLLELASGILDPAQGKVILGEETGSREEGGKSTKMFYLFQSPERMFFSETVMEELLFGIRRMGIPPGERFSHAAHALSLVGLDLDLLVDHSPFRLSFGEMRRLALGIAVSLQPRILLMDEPSACMDHEGMKALRSVVAHVLTRGGTVVVSSHDVDFLAEVCDRIVFLERGGIRDDLSLPGKTLPAGVEWPRGRKPLVLELQERMTALEGPRALSIPGFARRLLAYAETDVPRGRR
jgi:energy-coupling factor transport system ATP-binding protein